MLHRRSIRLKNYDFSREGYYFITICTNRRLPYFGEVDNNGQMHLSTYILIAKNCWLNIPSHFPDVLLDEFVIMPDHIHGIIYIMSSNPESYYNSIKVNIYQQIIPRSVGSIVRGFKIGVTKDVRVLEPGTIIWHRNFYEHIIRNTISFNLIRTYIKTNPMRWANVQK